MSWMQSCTSASSLLACVVDMIVEGQDHIQPYHFVLVFLKSVPLAEADGNRTRQGARRPLERF
jgi:hypothetical protein